MRKKKKSRKEKEDESGFVPLTEDSVKHSIEIPVKEIKDKNIEKIEIKREKGKGWETRKRKAKDIISKSIKTKGYELIISEKPQASAKIAFALSNGKAIKRNLAGVPYYELSKDGKKIIVACAVGHLFSLTQKTKNQNGKTRKSDWPVFDIEWKPNFQIRKEDFSKKYYSTLSNLAKNASSFTISCDYDIEGELIGYNIMRFICKQKDANRMKFSTLTKSELELSYKNKIHSINWGQAIAGETRHTLDWIYGINLSRALMSAIKSTGKFRIMSIGRVQGPTLHLVVDKELKIQNFKSTPYWQIFLLIESTEDSKLKTKVKYVKDIIKKAELKKFRALKGRKGEAKTEKKEQQLRPPVPFDLTTLQIEAYKFFGITPSRTLQIAQQLYLSGLISYPRTSSQKLPLSINYKKILDKIIKKFSFKGLKREKPVEGSKSDPAHPSIYPTGDFSELSGQNKKIYELIVRRFASCFCEDAIIENKKITVNINKMKFTTKGMEIKKKAWMDVYKAKIKEKEIPDLNGEVVIKQVKTEEKMTQPPRRYTPASIISELAKRNLGTKATRSSIIDTLYNRNYIVDKSIKATPLGIALVKTLEKNSPIIIDENLTRHFEREIETIQTAKKNLPEKQEQVINEAKKTLIKISDNLKKESKQKQIGKALVEATNNLYAQQREENKLTQCLVCKKGSLAIKYSRKTKRSFVACDAYPECKTTYSLPPNALIKKTDKTCDDCGLPKLMALRKGKRPWVFCFNPKCWQKPEDSYKYKKQKEATEPQKQEEVKEELEKKKHNGK